MEVIEQWVETVTKFSRIRPDNIMFERNATGLCGPPNVYPRYGALIGWKCGKLKAKQFVEVEFKQEVYVFGIKFYETFHAGAIAKVSALTPDNEWETLWKTDKLEDIQKSRIFKPSLKGTYFKTKHIRIDIDSTKAADIFVEIDAIKLKGTKEYHPDAAEKANAIAKKAKKEAKKGMKEQWVDKVNKYSSSHFETSADWAADLLRGKPNVYPHYGDYEGAWATGDMAGKEFVVVEFKKKVYVTGLDIYEVFHAGGVSRISLLSDKDDKWTTVWTSPKIEAIKQARKFSPRLKETDIKSKTVRLDLDCSVAGTWVEIDAIKLKGKKDDSDSDSSDSSDFSDSDSDDDEEKRKKKKKKSSACAVL